MIKVEELSKEYRIYKKTNGFLGNILQLISPEYVKKKLLMEYLSISRKGNVLHFWVLMVRGNLPL